MASPLTVFPSGNATYGSGGFTNPTYAYSDDGSYATRTGTSKNTWYGSYWDFTLSSLPDTAVVSAVDFEAQWHCSAADTSGPEFELGYCTDGSTMVANALDTSGQLADELVSYSIPGGSIPTVAVLKSANFRGIVAWRRTDNTAHIAYLDYVKVTITYSEVTGVPVGIDPLGMSGIFGV